jgi:hypothetical protein
MHMTLSFPNVSRSYSATRRCVCFWGHDSAIEIFFSVHEDALQRLSPGADHDEASILRVFDFHRARIHEVAGTAYARRRQDAYQLSAADF